MKGIEDLEEFEKETSLQDILLAMLDGEENLDLKTHIINPKDLASLNTLSLMLKSHKMEKSSKLIKRFLETYLRYMVSYQRKSREEIIKAITGLLEQEKTNITVTDRLTTNLKQ